MSFSFSTCDSNRALDFLKKLYPSKTDKCSWELMPKLKILIDGDILRVDDPDFHQPATIRPGKRYDSSYEADISNAIKELQHILHE